MMSDACFDFLDEFELAALTLAEAVHWYSSPDYGSVYGEEIDALRRACVKTRKDPLDIEARAQLLKLSAAVMRVHDAPAEGERSKVRAGEMRALMHLIRAKDEAGSLGDPERLVADLGRDD